MDALGKAPVLAALTAVPLFADARQTYSEADADASAEVEVTDDEVRIRWLPDAPLGVQTDHALDALRAARIAGLPEDEREALRAAEDLAIVSTWRPEQATVLLYGMALGAGRVGGDPTRFLALIGLIDELGGVPSLLDEDPGGWVVWRMPRDLRAGLLAYGKQRHATTMRLEREAAERAAQAERDGVRPLPE